MRVARRYEIVRALGHGGMAVVDLARDVELDRPVALKRLADNLARDEELRARFLREARLAARLQHPNVVRVYDVGEDGGTPFIAMEYVDGETLAELVARRGPLPTREVAELGVQLCRGLEAAHVAGLVHRDVKPQNLLLRRDGLLKLGDFGIAVALEGTRLTSAGTVLGTAAYRAPEQARGEEVTAAADLYSAGAVLHELLTGRPPADAPTVVEVDGRLLRIVEHCLAAEPAARPASAAGVARALAALLPRATTPIVPPPASERPTAVARPRTRRSTSLAAAAVAVLAIVGGTAALLATRDGGSPPPRPQVARVVPVPHAAQPAEQAQNLARWLTRYSR